MLTDCEIMRRVHSGERELFGELHVRHHERVFRFVAHSVWQREAAEDVAGTVWLRAYAAADKFEPRAENSVLAWLLTIASHCITDYRRRLKPQVSLDDEEENTLSLTASLSTPGAEREAMKMETQRAVRGALADLREGDRQIIYLAHCDELNSSQIAQILDKPSVSAVTSHLHRAMRHLKAALENSEFFSENAASQSPSASEVGRRKSA
jgi:RNA polymerase sigma-70 factor (ECF subfamily)